MGQTQAQTQGREAEDLAARYFEARGFRIRDRNYKSKHLPGELDLVVEKGLRLVFVEVRFRRSIAFGGAVDTVDPAKQRRIYRVALEYAAKHRCMERIIQFDVVAVRRTRNGPEIEHIEDAFEAPM